MANLRDQLLKAGLIDKKARHLADQEDRKKAKAAKSDAALAAEAAAEETARRQRLEAELEAKRQADRQREAERLEQARAVERLHRVESTIDRNEVTIREGRRRFYFRAGGTRVGRFDLHGRQADDLEDGLICIVRDPTDATRPFKLMDDAGLAELRSIDPTAVVFHAPAWRPIDEPSADVAVPAELPETGQTPQEVASGELPATVVNDPPGTPEASTRDIALGAGTPAIEGVDPATTDRRAHSEPFDGSPGVSRPEPETAEPAAPDDSVDGTSSAPDVPGTAGSL